MARPGDIEKINWYDVKIGVYASYLGDKEYQLAENGCTIKGWTIIRVENGWALEKWSEGIVAVLRTKKLAIKKFEELRGA